VSASARHVFDVTGAGDTVIATLALGLVGGLDLVSAAVVANRTAGLAVELPGAAVISLRDLARTFPGPELRAGAVERETLLSAVRWWRLCGRRIVFTNGCFDLLHIGHLALLRQAAAEGDVLIVGLNSDASVSRLKGPTRPIHDAHARAEVLGAIDVVDAVVVFDEDTPLELLKELRPDVLVKGADYRIEDVVGRAEVESWGGRVHLASLVPQQSTTGIVARMRGDAGETR
jgi:D-beta-D-heptose 7-phosphate kinase/D-beta-D-heptose 1-phosphate adenosyltransferase